MRLATAVSLSCVALFLPACSGGDSPTGGGNPAAGPPSAISAFSGGSQQVPAGELAPLPLVARVVDAQGRAVPNATVTFTPETGSGNVSAPSATTGSDGQARVSWTVGRSAGTHAVTARVGSLTPAVFTATVTPNGRVNATVTFVDTLVAHRARALQASAAGGWVSQKVRGRLAWMSSPGAEIAAAQAPSAPREVPGSLLVTLRPAALEMRASGFRARMGRQEAAAVSRRMERALERFAGDGRRLDVSPQLGIARLRVEPGSETRVMAELRADPSVLRVERDAFAYAAGGVFPNDPFRAAQAWHYQMVDLPRAWRRTTGSNGVLVAVVDDGIRFDHPDLAANLTADGYDFVSDDIISNNCGTFSNAGDGNGYDSDPTVPARYSGCALATTGGHGLHVAGTIGAAGNNAVGVTGVAWSVRVRPVRVLGVTGNGSYFDIAQGILYAAGLPASDGNGGFVLAPSAARIINLSLGGPSDSQMLRDAVVAAANAGSLLVVAAGNENTSSPSYPAAYPEVLTVSAVGPTYLRASYSNWGPHVDIAAPGGDIGLGNFSYGVASTQWNFQTGTPTYGYLHGTSMATPHVSGAAALLLALEPSLTAAELRMRLLTYAVDLGPAGPDDVFGVGLLNVRNSLVQSTSIQGRLFGRVYDAGTGAIVAEAQGSGSTFQVGGLPDGVYHVFAGIDDENDGVFGTNGFRWGGFTTADGTLRNLHVQGSGDYPASFSIGFGSEREPNGTPAQATRLMLGGSLYGFLPNAYDRDHFAVTLPAGSYVFETVGPEGACGLATNADTKLTLRSPDGAVIAEHDDVDAQFLDLCSHITQTVSEGTYTVEVSGFTPGWYRILVRPL